jgi:hypothetical protein
MRTSKSNRIFLTVITGALCLAGTGLTIANNWENDPQIAAVAITLSACFFAAEGCFFWGHKVFERLNRLWRKATLAVGMGLLVLAMASAVYSELEVALDKLSGRAVAQNVNATLESANANATQRERMRNSRIAIQEVAKGKINIRVLPFVLCYVAAGLVSIVILAVQIGERARPTERRASKGDQVVINPAIADHARQIGLAPPASTVKAYEDRNGAGLSIWVDSKYVGYISKSDIPNL